MYRALQGRRREALAALEAREIFLVEYAQDFVDIDIAVQEYVRIRGRITAAVRLDKGLVTELRDVFGRAAGLIFIRCIRIERLHERVRLELVRVGAGPAHFIVHDALPREHAVLELVVPALLPEDFRTRINERIEDRVEVDARQIYEVARIPARDGIVGFVGKSHGVEEGVHRGFHQLDEGLPKRISLASAQYAVLKDVKNAGIVLRQRMERDAEGAVFLGPGQPDGLQPGAAVTQLIERPAELAHGARVQNSEPVNSVASEHTEPPYTVYGYYTPNFLSCTVRTSRQNRTADLNPLNLLNFQRCCPEIKSCVTNNILLFCILCTRTLYLAQIY